MADTARARLSWAAFTAASWLSWRGLQLLQARGFRRDLLAQQGQVLELVLDAWMRSARAPAEIAVIRELRPERGRIFLVQQAFSAAPRDPLT